MIKGVVFVTFNPNQAVFDKINMVARDEQIKVCVVDNSLSLHHPTGNPYDSSVSVLTNGNRGGIAGAFNIGIKKLIECGCTGFFTFDQDSDIPHNFFSSMEEFVFLKNANIACPNFYDINSKTQATFIKLHKFHYQTGKFDRTAFAISSGMYISKTAYEVIGEFNCDYFIDHVDTDFCLRALSFDIPIHVNHDICLAHQIGCRTLHRVLGVTLKPNHHNSTRKYFIARNGTHLSFKYGFKYPSYFFMNVLRLGHEAGCTLLYEDKKLEKINSLLRGVVHAITGKLGAYK